MSPDKKDKQKEFLNQLRPDLNFSLLFQDLPQTLFFAKDANARLIMGNKLFVHHCGFREEEEIIGLSDDDIFPPELAEQYKNDDIKLLSTGAAKNNIIELFPNYLGDPTWFSTTKIPLFNQDGKIIGLCGTCQSLDESSQFVRPYKELAKALDYIKENYHKKITEEHLAQISCLSVRQFERRFKDTFKTTSHQYIIKLRILKSCKQLLKANKSISELALDLGFYDQSAFTKAFKKYVKTTPLKYQKKHLK
ncbi:probable transcription regulator [Lentisphaera araneosa HTCC2155]|uniref:Probable transcription regulator n=1 Tax=Lentisphaera araneosa HTCC2155 TaxID=313628 RepID=A6DP44_9BACT|nr:AraC family transcriptional regulator [Lentisphaera araneosa]EDM26576.1 probable transcription regulator [Lentisphaera araneosa HTCC2155]